MNIGIISNKSHAKSHAAALRKRGHKIYMLGGNPQEIPPSIEVLICRPASIAHGGFHSAMAAKQGGMRVILANGVSEIIRALEGPPEAEEESLEIRNATDTLTVLSRLLGCYGSPLHDPAMGPMIQTLAARRGDEGQVGFQLWKQALGVCKKDSVRNRAKAEADGDNPLTCRVYSYPLRGAVRQLAFFVTDQEALSTVLGGTALAGTREEAERQKEKQKKRLPEVAVPVVEIAVPEVAVPEVEIVVPVVVPVVEPEVQAAQIEVPVPEPAAPELAEAWDSQLRSAISLVLAEMREVGIEYLTVRKDGTVDFKRVQVTRGTLMVSEED